ncbi:MAG: PTS sugar transporter subunit IIB [Deltaproteobacteria bacterium]|nr:PTS sugar transporter subunit IIB [Deltaproteobacteria bacterium]
MVLFAPVGSKTERQPCPAAESAFLPTNYGLSVMPIVLSRIDQRLIHGQILLSWLPYLKDLHEIVVVDDRTANSELLQRITSAATPNDLRLTFKHTAELTDFLEKCSEQPARNVMLLFKGLGCLPPPAEMSPYIRSLNLGNFAHMDAVPSLQISDCFAVNEEELTMLKLLASEGITIYCQSVPDKSKKIISPNSLTWPR